jgi:hypothetical protein
MGLLVALLATVAGLAPAPERVVARCEALAASRSLPVHCPRRLPQARWVVAHRTLRTGRCEYLVDLAAGGHRRHALAGGRCGRWPLRTRDGGWPAATPLARDLGLVGSKPQRPGRPDADRTVRARVVRRIAVAGHPGLVLTAAPFPDGGVHGGHTIAMWNQRGHGYVLSLHGRSTADVLAAAGAMSRASAAAGPRPAAR